MFLFIYYFTSFLQVFLFLLVTVSSAFQLIEQSVLIRKMPQEPLKYTLLFEVL